MIGVARCTDLFDCLCKTLKGTNMDADTVKGIAFIYGMLATAFARSNAFTMVQNFVTGPMKMVAKKTWMDLKGSNVVTRYFVTEHRVLAFVVLVLTGKENALTHRAVVSAQVLNWVGAIPLAFVDVNDVLTVVKDLL